MLVGGTRQTKVKCIAYETTAGRELGSPTPTTNPNPARFTRSSRDIYRLPEQS